MSHSFISTHASLLEGKGRLRVAQQLHAVMKDWYGSNKSLKQLKILDYGCSNGIITNFIAKYSQEIIGIDVDKIAIKQAKQKFQTDNLTFLLTKNERLPFKKNSFDLVICNQVYSYLNNPNLMINEIYRVIRKEGICLFTGDNLLRPIEPLYNILFMRLLPRQLIEFLLSVLGYKNIYIGQYKTYWGLKKLFNKFIIYDYTIKVLKNSKQYKYKNLEKYTYELSVMPSFLLRMIEPFFPSFIFLLKKV